MLGRQEGAGQREVGGAGGVDRLERGLVGPEHVEAGHDDVEERVALLLALAALGRSLQDLVVDGAQERGDDVGLAGELAPEVGERQLGGLGDIRERDLGPALARGTGERGGEDAALAVWSGRASTFSLAPYIGEKRSEINGECRTSQSQARPARLAIGAIST